jgi:hypothetical protein
MTPLELIRSKREHAARLANQRGAAGEHAALADMEHWMPRPSGKGLSILLAELAATGYVVRSTSFDAIHIPGVAGIDFTDAAAVRAALPHMTFIEIKTANQARVKPGFSGFFFALTEGEIAAAEMLGFRHRVALYNNLTGELMLSSVQDILARARSSNWQLSVQL